MGVAYSITGGPGAINVVTNGAYQVGVWYTRTGELRVGRIQRGVQRWGVDNDEYEFAGALRTALNLPVGTGFDNEHRIPAIAVDGNGRLHVWAGMHNDGPFYVRSVDPHTSDTWTATAGWVDAADELPDTQGALTYPTPITRPDGSLWLYFRDRPAGDYGTGRANSYYWTRTPTGTTWSGPTMLFQGLEVPDAGVGGAAGADHTVDDRTNFSAYPTPPFVEGPTFPHPGRMHMFWMWSDHGVTGINWLLCYGYSDDGGLAWNAVDGTALTVPITPLNNLAARLPGGAMIRSIARASNIVVAELDTADHGITAADTVTVQCTKASFEGEFDVAVVGNPNPTSIAWVQAAADDSDPGVGQITTVSYVNRGPICVHPQTGLPHILFSDPKYYAHRNDTNTAWEIEEIDNPLGGHTHSGRFGGANFVRGHLWGLVSSWPNAQKRQRVFRITDRGPTSPVVTMSGDVGRSGWESPMPDPEAYRLHGTIECLVPSGDRPAGFTFGRGNRRRTDRLPAGPVWPDETTTGVPAGTELTVPSLDVDGNFNTTSDGQIVDALEIPAGAIVVNHNNVTITRCRATADPDVAVAFFLTEGKTGTVIEDCEFSGGGVSGGDITIRRCNIHHCENGFHALSNFVAEDNYIHDLYRDVVDPHNDGLQTSFGVSSVVLRGNNFDLAAPGLGGAEQGPSSGIQFETNNDSNVAWLVENNRIVMDSTGTAPGATVIRLPEVDATGNNLIVRNNRLRAGLFGYVSPIPPSTIDDWSGNVDDDTGEEVP